MNRPIQLSAAFVTATITLGFAASPLAAQADLVTDRPDQTESAVTVPVGSVQIESGVLHTREDAGSVTFEATEILGTLVRVGLLDRLELRIGFDGIISVPGESGLGDAFLGTKFVLADESANSPQMAVLVGTSVPIGEDGFTSDDYAPSARLALSKSLANGVGIGFNIGAEFPEEEEIILYTLAAGYGLSDVHGVFFELFGDSESSHSFDTGLTFLARPNLQFDASAGIGISDEAPDWFVGVGVSVRLPV